MEDQAGAEGDGQPGECFSLPDIQGMDPDRFLKPGQTGEIGPRPDQGGDPGPLPRQSAGEVRADEALGTGDQDRDGLKFRHRLERGKV